MAVNWEEKLKDVPEDAWPLFLKAARDMGKAKGKTIDEVLREYDEKLKRGLSEYREF